jgi:hypothetical protein
MTAALWSALIGLLGALTGVGVSAWLVQRREREQRQLAFLERQLREFYSPMHGLRAEILTRSQLRLRIQETASQILSESTDGGPGHRPLRADPTARQAMAAYERLIEDDNTTFKKQLLPAYQKMAIVFRENLWLADADTQGYYSDFIAYLDVWERHLREAIPGDVIAALGHKEANLHPFYEHLERRYQALRNVVQSGRYSPIIPEGP